ncbi:MAG: hypothetical protein P9X24_18740 [Candidatus Hatepunaea meridiana]|nr:hypothetical protein [Candidatus Hatepunaea meridiana]
MQFYNKTNHLSLILWIFSVASLVFFNFGCTKTKYEHPHELRYGSYPLGGKFIFDYPKPGQILPSGKMDPSPRGRHNFPIDSSVWIVLSDRSGGYFIQTPQVKLNKDGTWESENVLLGKAISTMIIISIMPNLREAFHKMARDRELLRFERLPEGSVVLSSVNVRVGQ